MTPLEQAKEYINSFCEFEYGDPADFDNLRDIPIAYTDYEELGISVSVSVNLVDYKIEYDYRCPYNVEYDRLEYDVFNTLEEMLPVLECMTFDCLVCLPDDMVGDADE